MGLSDVVFGDRDFSEVDELIVLEDDVPWAFSVKKQIINILSTASSKEKLNLRVSQKVRTLNIFR